MEKSITYNAKGHVFGKYWGGGSGGYKAKSYSNETLEGLRSTITQAVNDGSIDDGMGFEEVIGAMMSVQTITSIEIDGKTFTNSEEEIEFFGDLDEDQQEWMLETY